MTQTHSLKKLPKNTFEIEVQVPWETIQNEYKNAFEQVNKDFSLEGFRKGNVPKEVAEKHIPKETVYQRALQNLLPGIYEGVVKKESLKPVMSPRIELLSAKENEPWKLRFKVAGRPIVSLDDYKKLIKDVISKHKKADIWVPGKDKERTKEQTEEDRQKLLNEILDALIQKTKVEISDLIIEEELNARLSKLVDDVQKIGLTMDSYLASKGISMDELKKQYSKEIEGVHKLEFLLGEIADQEKIEVKPEELTEIFGKITNEKERQQAEQNAYFYAAVIRKQKTLDFLLSL